MMLHSVVSHGASMHLFLAEDENHMLQFISFVWRYIRQQLPFTSKISHILWYYTMGGLGNSRSTERKHSITNDASGRKASDGATLKAAEFLYTGAILSMIMNNN